MVMPSGFYEIMTDHDLDAVIAYLHTIKPMKNRVPDPVYKMPQGHPIPPGGEKPFTESMLSDKVNKGRYLATIGHCMECHTPLGPRGREFATRLGAGGFELPGPWGVAVSGNITSSKDKGIGAWTDAEIKRAITQGISRDGGKLKPPMGYRYYATVAASDLDAMVAYLRTVPPKNDAGARIGAIWAGTFANSERERPRRKSHRTGYSSSRSAGSDSSPRRKSIAAETARKITRNLGDAVIPAWSNRLAISSAVADRGRCGLVRLARDKTLRLADHRHQQSLIEQPLGDAARIVKGHRFDHGGAAAEIVGAKAVELQLHQ